MLFDASDVRALQCREPLKDRSCALQLNTATPASQTHHRLHSSFPSPWLNGPAAAVAPPVHKDAPCRRDTRNFLPGTPFRRCEAWPRARKIRNRPVCSRRTSSIGTAPSDLDAPPLPNAPHGTPGRQHQWDQRRNECWALHIRQSLRRSQSQIGQRIVSYCTSGRLCCHL